MHQPTEQVKRLTSLLSTLEEKKILVKRLEEDMNSHRLALEKAKENLGQVREQIGIELKKLDPGIPATLGVPVPALPSKASA